MKKQAPRFFSIFVRCNINYHFISVRFFSVLFALGLTLTSFNAFAINTPSPVENFLTIADIHLDNKTTHTMAMQPLGYNSKNDLDHNTFVKLIATIDKGIKTNRVPKPQFILILGDVAGHEKKSIGTTLNDESAVFGLLKKTFHNIPIFYVFGNNDSLAQDYGPFTTYNTHKTKSYSPYTTAMANGWRNGFLSTGFRCDSYAIDGQPCLISENRDNGYYVAYINTKFKLIVLNSILFSAHDKSDTQKAQEEFAWLEKQMQKAQDHNESVLIAMHIPVGNNIFDHSNFWRDSCRIAFIKIINQYKNNLAGILAAHTHMEELKIIQEQKQKNTDTTLMFFTAGLSTSHSNLPAIKTFFYKAANDNKWIISDYTAFNFIENNDHSFSIKTLYTYRDTYCKNQTNRDNKTMLDCLQGKSVVKIISNVKEHYTNGNPNIPAIIFSPKDLYVQQAL